MSGPSPAGPAGPVDPVTAGHHDPMSADRRTMIIAAIAMMALIAVGVGSAAVFARSSCAVIGPDTVQAREAGTGVDAIVASTFADLDDGSLAAVRAGLIVLEDELGPVTGIAEVSGADRLAASVTGIAAAGSITTSLDADGAGVRATAGFDDAAAVTGDGGLFSLALANPLTGQVDALLSLDDDLQPGACTDTATVGNPLAFALDATRGELLLLRVDEDGSSPVVERRGPSGIRIWTSDLDLGIAPPGTLGERSSAATGADLIVVGRRSAADDDPDLPVLTAVDRRTGERRWTAGREVVPEPLRDQDAVWVEVLAVGRDTSVLAMSPDQDGARGPASLVTVTHADAAEGITPGSPLGTTALGVPPQNVVAAEVGGDDDLLVLVQDAQRWSLYHLTDPQSPSEPVAAGDGTARGMDTFADGRIAVAAEALTVLTPGRDHTFDLGLSVHDVALHRGGVTLLLRLPTGGDEPADDRAIAVTFGR